MIMDQSIELSGNIEKIDNDKPVFIIIDECCYSRIAIKSLLLSVNIEYEIFTFSNTKDFLHWHVLHPNEIYKLIIYIHDRMSCVPNEMVRFLAEDVDKLNIRKFNVILCSDDLPHFQKMCISKLKIFNLLDGRNTIMNVALQLDKYINSNDIKPYYNESKLSLKETIAINNILRGISVKEASNKNMKSYKTLSVQRTSALKKLGMRTIQDLVKYKKLVSILYLHK